MKSEIEEYLEKHKIETDNLPLTFKSWKIKRSGTQKIERTYIHVEKYNTDKAVAWKFYKPIHINR